MLDIFVNGLSGKMGTSISHTANKAKNILITADSQSSSQIGDISRFKGMHLITPTEHEARLSSKDMNSGLVILAEKIKKLANAKNIYLKLHIHHTQKIFISHLIFIITFKF